MRTVLFLSDMIVQPVGRALKGRYAVEYADLDAFMPTLQSRVEADALVILFDPRFFYPLYPDGGAAERLAFLQTLLQDFRSRNRTPVVLGNLFDTFPNYYTAETARSYQKLIEINLALEKLKETISDLEICDLFSVGMRLGSERLFQSKNRFLFQSPFTKEGAAAVADAVDAALVRLWGKRKKVLVLDGDNTLWGGIVGEDGVEGVACDENYPGIAYKRFQLYLKALKASGLVLTMVSKNNEADVWELFAKRQMPLRLDDFILTKINWNPKSQNIAEIAGELNVGLESLLFIDDNPFEIEEVRNVLPQVGTLLLDKENPLGAIDALAARPDIHAVTVTDEDRQKSEQYRSEKRRAEVFQKASDPEAFIRSLGIGITWWRNNRGQLARITQLINKTNQFNLTTRRYTQSEVEALMAAHDVLSFKVTDKFGDMGIVGVVIIQEGVIDTFLLSCRVLGRGIEERIIDAVLEVGGPELEAEYIPSAKNAQVADLYERLGFELIGENEEGIRRYRFVQKRTNRPYIKLIRGDEV